MRQKKVKIEFLIKPFCLSNRDYVRLSELCRKYKVTFDTYDLWDLDDQEVNELPEYISSLIHEWRTGQKAGDVYSSVFINGRRIPIRGYARPFHIIEEEIITTLRGTQK